MVLALYGLAMSLYFGPRLIAEGQAVKFWISVGVEAAFVIGLYFALNRKEKLAANRPPINTAPNKSDLEGNQTDES